MTPFLHTVDEILVESLGALLDATAEISDDPGVAGSLDLVAVIGFGGSQIRGCLGVAASARTVFAIHPLGPEAAAPGRAAEDWLAELNNQLLGRLKHRLLTHGVEISFSTPIVLRGLHIRVARPYSETSRCYRAPSPMDPVVAWIDLTLPETLEFRLVPEVSSDGAPGESFFF